MAGPVSRAELSERLKGFTMTTYLSLSDLLAGGVALLAAEAALSLPGEGGAWRLQAFLILVSVLMFAAIHALWRLGSIFASWSSGVVDQLAPLMLGLCEFAQFILLSSHTPAPLRVTGWAWATVGQLAMAALFVWNRVRHLDQPGQYTRDAAEFVASYREWMRQGWTGATIWAAVCALLGTGVSTLPPGWAFGCAIADGALCLCGAFVNLRAAVQFNGRFHRLLPE